LSLVERGLETLPAELLTYYTSAEEGEKFWEMTPLTKLDLSFNALVDVSSPSFDELCVELLSLKVRKNKLQRFRLQGAGKMRHLDVSQNELCGLEEAIACMPELRELLASFNAFSSPLALSGIENCACLQLLNLSNNQLVSFPEDVSLPHLTSLNLANNKLESLPDALICPLALLETLDLKSNKLLCLPDLSGLRSLRSLDVMDNKLSIFPRLPSRASVLANLNLGCNRLTDLDYECLTQQHSLVELLAPNNLISELNGEAIGQLSSLKVMDFASNNLKELPHQLGYLQNLNRLVIDANPLRAIRRTLYGSTVDLKAYLRTRGGDGGGVSMGGSFQSREADSNVSKAGSIAGARGIDSAIVARLRDVNAGALNLSALSLTRLDENLLLHLHELAALTTIDLSCNEGLKEFPVELTAFPTLKVLRLSRCKLGSIRQESGECFASLEQLDVSFQPISEVLLDGIIARLCLNKFHVLTLTGCSLTYLPGTLSLCQSLRELNASQNRLTSLGSVDWSKLQRLETLDVSNNSLSELSDVHRSINLAVLQLDNNNLTQIDEVGLTIAKKTKHTSTLKQLTTQHNREKV